MSHWQDPEPPRGRWTSDDEADWIRERPTGPARRVALGLLGIALLGLILMGVFHA